MLIVDIKQKKKDHKYMSKLKKMFLGVPVYTATVCLSGTDNLMRD